MWLECLANRHINLRENHLLSYRIFIKSAVDQKSLKLGIYGDAWIISIVQKILLP